ncbi:hypothetical protein BGX29_004026, partial [Mortierella sp. GBA35]
MQAERDRLSRLFAGRRAEYNRKLAKRHDDLTAALAQTDDHQASSFRRLDAVSQRRVDTAALLLSRATEANELYRAHRLPALRQRLETRLVRTAVAQRLQDSLLQKKQAQRLQDSLLQRKRARQRWDKKNRFKHPLFYHNGTRLLDQYQLQPQPAEEPPPTIQDGPVLVSPAEAAVVAAVRSTSIDNTTPKVLYSDGSLINSGTKDIAMAFGVVDITHDPPLTVQGRTNGHASSAKAELMGLLAAIQAAPPEQDILILLDNQSVVDQYHSLVRDRLDTLPRKRFRSTYAGLWAVLAQVEATRQGTVAVEWVRGHDNNYWNELADKVAKEAARGDTVPWVVDLTQQSDIRTFA